mgnify:CR=1 FL=1
MLENLRKAGVQESGKEDAINFTSLVPWPGMWISVIADDGLDANQHMYIHLMFKQNEIILADGAWTESFQPGDHSLKGIATEQRGEIIALFPELETVAGIDRYGAARLSPKKHEAVYLSGQLGLV